MAHATLLTAEKAFTAAKLLQDEGKRVTSSALWEKAERVGSLSTAKKWADIWNSLSRGEGEERYRQLYEALINNEERPANADTLDEGETDPLESEFVGLGNSFARYAWELAKEVREKALEGIQDLAAREIQEAQAQEGKREKEVQVLQQKLTEAIQNLSQSEQQRETLEEEKTALEAIIVELRRDKVERLQIEEGLRKEITTLAQTLALTKERIHLVEQESGKLEELKRELSTLKAERDQLREELHEVSRERHGLDVRGDALSDNLNREILRTQRLEEEVRSLTRELAEARERAARVEATLEARLGL